MKNEIKVFAGRPSRQLATAICNGLAIPLGQAEIFKFSNDNTFVKINENVREADVFIVQTSTAPVDQNLMELLIMADALRRASAARITAVLPYYPYGRSDKKDQPRVPITARLVADLLIAAGVNRVITLDLHAPQIQGFFTVPLDNLTASNLLCDHQAGLAIPNMVVVATDAGSAKKANYYARRLRVPMAIMDKRRYGNDDSAHIENFIGDIEGRNAVIFDDEVDTAGTISETVRALVAEGAKDIYVACTHPVLSGPAVQRLRQAPIKKMIVTDSIPLSQEKSLPFLEVISTAPLFAEAIRRVHEGLSVSVLFT
jgi:ribose-phosphate pyrophosphokinase